jgi:tyrosyl-tRNA synthetase
VPEDVEEVEILAAEVFAGPSDNIQDKLEQLARPTQSRFRLDRLLVAAGLAESVSDAVRKTKQNAVTVDGEPKGGPIIFLETRKGATIRVGKKIKRVRFVV